jgi:WD40 repeat protein
MRRQIVLATAFMLTIYMFLPSFALGAQKASVASITALEWNPDGTKFATGDDVGVVKIWNVRTIQMIFTLAGHTGGINALEWSPDGTRLASASYDRTIRIWNAISGQNLLVLQGHTSGVVSIAWSPDGSKLASSSAIDEPTPLRIWNTSTGQLISSHRVSEPAAMAWSPDGSRLAGALPTGVLNVMNTTTFEDGFALVLSWGGERGMFAVAWSPNSQKVASGSSNGSVVIWDVATKQQLHDLRGNDVQPISFDASLIRSIAFSSDGRKLVSVCGDGTIRTWNATSGQVLSTTRINGPLEAAALSRDGQKLVYSRSKGTIQVISLNF